MLGAAGLGKTYELIYLASLDREQGLDVRFGRLASLGQTADGLEARLTRLAHEMTESTVIYLDAMDEVMVPVRTAGLIVERWIRESLSIVRPSIRMSCRSAVWPDSVDSAIRDVYGKSARCVAVLQPLSKEDIRAVARIRGIDPNRFLSEVESAGALMLAQQPLTLNMLLRMFALNNTLPDRRTELFDKCVQTLALERSERRDGGTSVEVPVNDLLEAAERLACVTLLSGREQIDMGDSPTDASLGIVELGNLPATGRRFDVGCVEAIGRSGLCEGDGDRKFRFAHRQIAEYLAGRRLARLLPHQARAMLASGLGWQAGVAGPLRETAAFAAMESTEIAAWITEHDPEVIGLSDVADASLRRRATMNLIEKFRRHELTDTQVGRDGIELAGFQYPNAERDLAPILHERGDGCEDAQQCVIELIETWKLQTMSDDLSTLMLDSTASKQARKAAGYAIAKIGTRAAKYRLQPLISGTADDFDLDLKGLALRCNWPESLSVPDLLTAITSRKDRNYYGTYDSFVHSLDRDGFEAAGHRLHGLVWAQSVVRRGREHEPEWRIAKRIAVAALNEIHDPGIAEALGRLLLVAASVHAGSVLVGDRDNASEDAPSKPALEGRQEIRRRLIESIVAIAPEESNVWWIGQETPSFHVIEDFGWFLSQAVNVRLSMTQRTHYAKLVS